MSTSSGFHLQARRFEGPPCGPTRNDARSADERGFDEALARARSWAEEGFTVWVFDQHPLRYVMRAEDQRSTRSDARIGPAHAGVRP